MVEMDVATILRQHLSIAVVDIEAVREQQHVQFQCLKRCLGPSILLQFPLFQPLALPQRIG